MKMLAFKWYINAKTWLCFSLELVAFGLACLVEEFVADKFVLTDVGSVNEECICSFIFPCVSCGSLSVATLFWQIFCIF
jgi:hypothetical protein